MVTSKTLRCCTNEHYNDRWRNLGVFSCTVLWLTLSTEANSLPCPRKRNQLCVYDEIASGGIISDDFFRRLSAVPRICELTVGSGAGYQRNITSVQSKTTVTCIDTTKIGGKRISGSFVARGFFVSWNNFFQPFRSAHAQPFAFNARASPVEVIINVTFSYAASMCPWQTTPHEPHHVLLSDRLHRASFTQR